jgi:FkbM family methyltransferase
MARFKYYLSVFSSILTSVDFWHSRPHLLVLKNGTKFYIRNVMDVWMTIESYVRSDYETHGPTIGNGWKIIDIGAALGDFSILAAQKSPGNTVFAVEPFKASYTLLKKNILLNKINNIIPINIAISNRKKVILKINENNLGNNSEFVSAGAKTLVKAVSLPQLFKTYKIDRCQLVKCDCEGAEFEIFNSMNVAAFDKIDNIVMEYHLFSPSFSLNQLVDNFQKHNFEVKLTPNPVHSNIGFLWARKIVE